VTTAHHARQSLARLVENGDRHGVIAPFSAKSFGAEAGLAVVRRFS
jgi:hypothetical protein